MSFSEALRAGRFPVALEITPPQRHLPAVLMRRASLLGAHTSAVNVIQRPDRQPSLEACLHLKGSGLGPAWHLVTRGREQGSLDADIASAAEGHLDLVLVIRGDHESPDAPAGLTIRQVTQVVSQALPGALVGATLNQYQPDQAAVFRNLLPKLSAGAGYVQTQPVFDTSAFAAAAERLRRESPATFIVPMVMPLPTVEAADRISSRLGVAIPEVIRAAGDPWLAFQETLATLRASGLADAIAIMTFEMDPPPETGRLITNALQNAGILAP